MPANIRGEADADAALKFALPDDDLPLDKILEDLERQLILRAYERAKGVKTETARLLGIKTEEVQADRVAAVQQLAQKFGGSVVLKGADSLCATSDGKLYVNKTGNPGMSSAGMGDVLTGMVAAFLAQGMSADDALLLAVHLHGAAGDALIKRSTASERWSANRLSSRRAAARSSAHISWHTRSYSCRLVVLQRCENTA